MKTARGRTVTGHAPMGGQASDQASERAPGRHRPSSSGHIPKRTPERGQTGFESQTKSTGTNLTTAPDGTARTLTDRFSGQGSTHVSRGAQRGSNWAANARNGSAEPCEALRKSPAGPHDQRGAASIVVHLATLETGLSRRRSRVRVPSLPLLNYLQIAFFVADRGDTCVSKHDRLLPRPQNRSQRCRRRLSKGRAIHSPAARRVQCANRDRPTAARPDVARAHQAAAQQCARSQPGRRSRCDHRRQAAARGSDGRSPPPRRRAAAHSDSRHRPQPSPPRSSIAAPPSRIISTR
jgi:hypothetical protein